MFLKQLFTKYSQIPCTLSNPTREDFETWQDMAFIYIKHSIGRFKFI